jgi:isopentenyl diphosphate isomerase/L-lactate dehydrogenase-like FMN-dependent dehydrogenase
VVRPLNKDFPILMDGGIRRGTDILKAIALGANGILIGRPILWGLAVNGKNGIVDVVSILKKEFIRSMILTGCRSIDEISRELIWTLQDEK